MPRIWTSEPADDAAELEMLGGRVVVTSPWRVVERGSDSPYDLEITARFDEALGRIVCSEVIVRRRSSGTELTGTALREIAIQAAVSLAGEEMVSIRNRDGRLVRLGGSRVLFPPAEGRPRDEVIADAAILYTVTRMTGRRPLAEVAAKLGVSQSTATRFVATARDGGLLDG